MATHLDRYLEWISALKPYPDPTRMVVFCSVAQAPRTLEDLAATTGAGPVTVAAHLDLLQSFGLVEREGADGQATYRVDEGVLRRALEDLAPIPNDFRALSGQRAPLFRLPAADGQEVSLKNCLAEGPAIVWLSRGLSCPICRRHRAQLTLG